MEPHPASAWYPRTGDHTSLFPRNSSFVFQHHPHSGLDGAADPKTNGIREGFHKTVLDEHDRMAFRKKAHPSSYSGNLCMAHESRYRLTVGKGGKL